MKGKVEETPLDTCRHIYDKAFERNPETLKHTLELGIIDGMICARNPYEVVDTCQGDSGSGLKYQRGGKYYIAGITSFGIFGCSSNYPSFYTRVSSYLGWIESVVCDADENSDECLRA